MTFLADGYSVKYIPIEYAKRAGESKFHWYKDTRRYATQVVRMILSYNPLRIFMPVGLALLRDRLRQADRRHHRIATSTSRPTRC